MAPSAKKSRLPQRRHSTGSNYKRPRPVVPPLPTSVAWLEHTALEMTATANKSLTHCSTEYLLHVHFRLDRDSKPQSWQVSRSFDEYVAFQQRLLKTLSYGHACSAECRWLHSFAKKYFPKKTLLFGNCSTTTMNQRREKLIRYVNVLRSSLLNRGNHGCAIVVNGLANEFTAFLEGDHHRTDEGVIEDTRCCSVSSSLSTSSTDASSNAHDHEHLASRVCQLTQLVADAQSSLESAQQCLEQVPMHPPLILGPFG